MAEWAVIADDLTGANTAGVLLTTHGFRALTTIQHRDLEKFKMEEYDAVVVNAASRTLDAEAAYERVKWCTQELLNRGFKHFSKRIDSTIRGNLGAEIEGMLAALPPATVACVVAVYPASGRMVVGGHQLVNCVPVHKTAAGSDPIKPVRSSFLAEEIAVQTSLPQGYVELAAVLHGLQAVAESAWRQIQAGARILVFDAISFKDIRTIAEAMHSLQVEWISVDPGPFTQSACELAYTGKPRCVHKKKGKIFIVAGSASDITRSQMSHLQSEAKTQIVNVDIREFLDSDGEQPQEGQIAQEIWNISQKSDVFGLRAAEHINMVLDIKTEAKQRGITTDDVTRRITYALARIARKALALQIPDLKGIYLTGGDMTVAFCEEAKVDAIEVIDEVQPHATFGVLVGGPLHGVAVVTKGGLIGTPETAMVCAKYMLSH